MTQSLRINQKEYLPSTVLSKQFGYSSDYISKLAREEKILASQIGRQWFVEPESLRTFSLQAEFEKKIRKEKLRQERKIERTKKTISLKPQPVQSAFDFDIFAQTVLVLICGFFVGYLSWISIDSDLHLSDLDNGSQQALSLLSEVPMPNISIAHTVERVAVLFSSETSSRSLKSSRQGNVYEGAISTDELSGNFADLPQFPQRKIQSIQEEIGVESYARKMFSDEVEVLLDEDGAVLIKPVFKSVTQKARTFSVVPVAEHSEN